MAYLTEAEVLERAAKTVQRAQKTAKQVLKEDTAAVGQKFDIFLSHSSAEPEGILLGIKGLLEDRDMSVYVDRYTDPDLAQEGVTAETAEILRGRMRDSAALLYVHSRHSTKSRWMPWELGFFDGHNGNVGILPVTQNQEETFKGEEYLSLYPYVDLATSTATENKIFWIRKSRNTYASMSGWIKGTASIRARD